MEAGSGRPFLIPDVDDGDGGVGKCGDRSNKGTRYVYCKFRGVIGETNPIGDMFFIRLADAPGTSLNLGRVRLELHDQLELDIDPEVLEETIFVAANTGDFFDFRDIQRSNEFDTLISDVVGDPEQDGTIQKPYTIWAREKRYLHFELRIPRYMQGYPRVVVEKGEFETITMRTFRGKIDGQTNLILTEAYNVIDYRFQSNKQGSEGSRMTELQEREELLEDFVRRDEERAMAMGRFEGRGVTADLPYIVYLLVQFRHGNTNGRWFNSHPRFQT